MIDWLIDWLADVSAAFIALRSIVIVDLLGIEKLTSAFGFISLFQGFVALAGLPINGESLSVVSSHLNIHKAIVDIRLSSGSVSS